MKNNLKILTIKNIKILVPCGSIFKIGFAIGGKQALVKLVLCGHENQNRSGLATLYRLKASG
jgi:hypothetical protein